MCVAITRGHLRQDVLRNLSDRVPASLVPQGQIEIRAGESDGMHRASARDPAAGEVSKENATTGAARSEESVTPGDLPFFNSEEVATERFQIAMSRLSSSPVLLVLARCRENNESLQWMYNRTFPILVVNRGHDDIRELGLCDSLQ